ncbi:hypothetical protein GSS88_02230 [Corynebacterium sp. 3HC-13]|uniref:hypothetical protein n=1 Tax=Corynebacterium poyangense TaxID=2684405 RepID=UPI001CCBA11C|nr:hypothetical protein [Corynebacterium poyangense]MBZ8176617.1 hypothetical protein [Corynebacterium poyangense]
MAVTNRRFVAKTPNTLLGIIPLGHEERGVPIGAIAGVTSSLSVKAVRLIIGILLVIFALIVIFDAPKAGVGFLLFLLLLIGLAIAASGIVASLKITNSGGAVSEFSVSVLEQTKLEQFANKLNEYLYSASPASQSWKRAEMMGNTGNPYQQMPQQPYSQPPQGFHDQNYPQQGYPQQPGFPQNYPQPGYPQRSSEQPQQPLNPFREPHQDPSSDNSEGKNNN